jgi:hypothetical protein
MSDFIIKKFMEPKIKNPVLVEGLPGIGHVGRLAAKHLCNELKAEKFASLYSDTFPPQVLIMKNGVVQEMRNDLYYWKSEEGKRDILFVIGNTQSSTPEGQYLLSNQILDLSSEYGVKMIYTLGGLGVGRIVDKPRVYGAVTHEKFIPELERLKVIVKRDGMGQIIGVSGLLLGLAKIRGLKGLCLMGETSGYYLDPNSAKAVLEVLCQLLGVKVDMSRLTEKAKAAERRVAEAQKMERKMMEDLGIIQKEPSEDQMRYIG